MDFFEFVLAISLTVALPITIFKSILSYNKSKVEAERGVGTGAGVTVAELKAVLVAAVREANAPLLERIETLERDGLLPPGGRGLLGGADDESEHDDEERAADGKTLGRRVHA